MTIIILRPYLFDPTQGQREFLASPKRFSSFKYLFFFFARALKICSVFKVYFYGFSKFKTTAKDFTITNTYIIAELPRDKTRERSTIPCEI